LIGLSGSVVMLTFTPLLCFAGALIPLVLLHSISVRDYRFSSVTMLLGGVMLNVFFASVILMMQYFVDFTQVRQMFLWSMGALDIVGYRELLFIGPAAVVIMLLIGTQSRAMNLLSIDHVTAAHLGVNVRRSVGVLLWSGAILTSLAVAVSGPIGFVGLIVPHSIRLVFSSDNRVLLPLSAIYGAIFLLFCDALGWRGMELLQQAGLPITQTAEIPVGVITALLGGPFFLYLLVSRKTGTTMM
jgi:iron complex transport system permease protein